MKDPKLVLGYITGGTIENEFMVSCDRFLEFDSRNRKMTLGKGFVAGRYLDDNRNDLARDFLQTTADYLLSVDTDQDFTPEGIYTLIDDMMEKDRAIEGALYFGILRGRLVPVWFIEGSKPGLVANIGSFRIGEVVPLVAIGMGCTLIRRDVFEKMGATAELGGLWYRRERIEVDGLPMHEGEDIGLCFNAKKLGFQTWGNSNVESGHYKKMRLDFNLFRMFYEDAKRRGVAY